MNFLQMKNEVRRLLNEMDPGGFYPEDDLSSWINQGALEVANRLECIEGEASLTVTAGNRTASLPEDFIRFLRVSTETKLKPTDIDYLDSVNDYWEAVEGAPTHYYLTGRTIGVYPKPIDNTTINLLYIKAPAMMKNDADICEIPQEYHQIVVYSATYKALVKDAKYSEAANIKAMYEADIAEARAEKLRRKPKPMMNWAVIR
jgi:hypothetical protein